MTVLRKIQCTCGEVFDINNTNCCQKALLKNSSQGRIVYECKCPICFQTFVEDKHEPLETSEHLA